MQKVLVFGQMSEFLSTVIKSCRANFGVKWRVFFSTSIFVQKCQFWEKKLNFVRNVDFFQTIVHYYWKWTSYWKTCLFSENCDFLCDCLYTSRNCRILIKTLIFLRKCLVHVLIFIKVFYSLENCYFDSKYHFIRWYFGQKLSDYKSLDKLSNFFLENLQSFNWFYNQFFRYLCFLV